MSEIYQRLAHSSWDCKYHVVIVPKRRRKLGEIFHALARQKECQILEGHLLPDHVHIVHRDSSEVSGRFGDRVSEREERYSDGPLVRQGTEFHGRALLGPWVRRVHSGLRVGASPQIHPRARIRGW